MCRMDGVRNLRPGLLLLTGLLVLGCAPLRAQPPGEWPVDSILSVFERDVRARAINNRGSRRVFAILYAPEGYAARRDSLLDGLERLALTSDSEHVRHSATSNFAVAGTTEVPFPKEGIVPRLMRIYQSKNAPLVQLSIRNYLPVQADRPAAAALLRSIAAGPDPFAGQRPDPIGDDRVEALHRLSEMGEEGRAVLQAMHRNGEARSPWARTVLEQMARRGFPVRDLRRERATPGTRMLP